MPLYVYECPVCHNRVELRRSMRDQDSPAICVAKGCPALSADPVDAAVMKRVPTAPASHFPGAASWRAR